MLRHGRRHLEYERCARREVHGPLRERLVTGEQAHPRCRDNTAGCDTGPGHATLDHETDRDLAARLVRRANHADRVPVLAEAAGLRRGYKAEVGLVVGVDTRHELDVGAVGVGELAVPRAPDRPVAPGPLLLAGRDRVVGPVHETGRGVMVVATEEVVDGVGDHVRGRHRDVAVDVEAVRLRSLRGHERGVVDPVVRTVGAGEGADRAARVVGDERDVRREEALVPLVRPSRDVRPPEEGLRLIRAVVQARIHLDERGIRAQANTVAAAHSLQRVDAAVPHGDDAVVVTLDRGVHGQEGRGAVVLGPVELDATRDPRSCEADERGLDDVVAVEEVVVGRLVIADVDAPADLRQQHEPNPLVLDVDGLPLPRRLLAGDPLDEGHRVDLAARALVDPTVEEQRVAVGRLGLVGVDRHRLAPAGDPASGEQLRLVGGGGGQLDTALGVVDGTHTATVGIAGS